MRIVAYGGGHYKAAFGTDPMIGFFCDIWDLDQGDGDDEAGLVYSKMTTFDTDITPPMMTAEMEKYGINVSAAIERQMH